MKLKIVLATLLLFALPTVAHAQDRSQVLQQLQDQLTTLRHQRINADFAQQAALQEQAAHEQRGQALIQDSEAVAATLEHVQGEADRYDTTVREHNGRCAGTFSDEVFVNQCNQRKADLDAWQSALNGRIQQVERDRATILARIDGFTQEDQEITQRVQRGQQTLDALDSDIQVTQQMIRRIQLDDSFLRDPRDRDRVSRGCLGLLSIEAQSQCMQEVFDGASPR